MGDIFAGKRTSYPATMDALYTLIQSMVTYVKTKETAEGVNGVSDIELENACRYAHKFPADYKACFYKELSDIDGIVKKLVKSPSFKEWFKQNSSEEVRCLINRKSTVS